MDQKPYLDSRLTWGLRAAAAVAVVVASYALLLGWARWKHRFEAAQRLEKASASVDFDHERHPLEWVWNDARCLRSLRATTFWGDLFDPPLDAAVGDDLAAFPECRSVYVHREGVEPEFLGRLSALPRLESVSLNHCRMTDSHWQALATLPSLTNLSFKDNRSLTDAAAVGLKRLERVIVLDLFDTSVQDRTLAESLPPNVEGLGLSYTRVTGPGLASLAVQPRLHYVLIANLRNPVDEPDLAPLLAAGKIVKRDGSLPFAPPPRGLQAWQAWSTQDEPFELP